MTALRRPVTRETQATIRDRGRVRSLVVTLEPAGISLRGKGCRTSYLLPYQSAWLRAVTLEVDRERAERKARRGKRQ